MFATFWIEEISAPTKSLQLQYVQNVFLNFPVLGANPVVNLTWPHVSVATLQKTFGGQWCSILGPPGSRCRVLSSAPPVTVSAIF
jgi:hypothetical protein